MHVEDDAWREPELAERRCVVAELGVGERVWVRTKCCRLARRVLRACLGCSRRDLRAIRRGINVLEGPCVRACGQGSKYVSANYRCTCWCSRTRVLHHGQGRAFADVCLHARACVRACGCACALCTSLTMLTTICASAWACFRVGISTQVYGIWWPNEEAQRLETARPQQAHGHAHGLICWRRLMAKAGASALIWRSYTQSPSHWKIRR